MKIAELPTGKVLQFPDETDDEAIDNAVQRHLADHIARTQEEEQRRLVEEGEKRAKSEREDADRRYKMQREEVWRQEDIVRTNNHKIREENERKYERDRADKYREEDKQQAVSERQEDQARHESRDAILFGMQQQMGLLVLAIEKLEAIVPAVNSLTRELDDLGSKIESSIDNAVLSLTAPKTLTFDARGKPLGIRYLQPANRVQTPLQLTNEGE